MLYKDDAKMRLHCFWCLCPLSVRVLKKRKRLPPHILAKPDDDFRFPPSFR